MRRLLILIVVLFASTYGPARTMIDAAFAAAGASTIGGAQEKITFTAPVFSDAGASEFRIALFSVDMFTSQVRITLQEVHPGTTNFKGAGRRLQCDYDGDVAATYISILNTGNFSTGTSLQKATITKCRADGKLPPGTISGVPQ